MQALTLERWVLDPGPDTGDPSSGADDTEEVPYAFTWTDTGDPGDLEPYAFVWDDDTAGPNAKDIAAGAGMGAALGGAVGTIFPGIGNAAGAGIGAAVGAIGGFMSGLFGGKKKKGRKKPRKKPTPKWVVAVMEDARRGLLEMPPNPSKSVDAVLVVSGQMSRDAYMLAKQIGQLPSQKYDQNRSAAAAMGGLFQKKLGRKIASSLKGLKPGEKALVSAAIPIGSSGLVLEALRKIRGAVSGARAEPAAPTAFTPEVLRMLARRLAEEDAAQDASILPGEPYGDQEESAPYPREPQWDEAAPDAYDTSGPPTTVPARAPTIDDLPRPVWHLSRPVMPRQMFARLLRAVPELQKLPRHVLRAIAGRGPRAQDTAGVDPVMRQYLMLPGETFAGIARNLTGDPGRDVELYAANPNHNPARMRVEIPPGWLEFTPLVHRAYQSPRRRAEAGAPAADSKAAPPKVKRASKDGLRQNTTRRVIQVQSGDWPAKIAGRTGAKAADPQWWRTLKSANPHKVVASDGNWQTLFPGELLNYPDSWPQSAEAKLARGQQEGPVRSQPEPVPIVPDDPLGPEPEPKPSPPPAPKPLGKDGLRPALTRRVIEVLVNDWPEKIARRTGALAADPQWWRTLKGVNPHKRVASDGNWETLFAGELLNYPDTWPAHAEAKVVPENPTDPVTPPPAPGPVSPAPGPVSPLPDLPAPSVPGLPDPAPIPMGGTADFASIWNAQIILVQWASRHPDVANPPDFGKAFLSDVTGTMTERTKSCLASFQQWSNERAASSRLRTDGVLDEPTRNALADYQREILLGLPPANPSPGENPIPGGGGTPGGGGVPIPGGGGTPGGGGVPIPGGGGVPIPGGWVPGQSPAPAPAAQAPAAEARNDSNDAAVLVIGGTMLSLLMR